jgi:hypothetical protein
MTLNVDIVKIRPILMLIGFMCLASAAVNAQPAITFTSGEFVRNGGGGADPFGVVSGTFRFQNTDSNISGILMGNPGSGVYTLCDFYGTPCAPGRTIRILDHITGRTALRQDAGFITVNGQPQATVFYTGDLKFEGGTVRIPYYFAKRRTFKITVPARLTGGMAGYPTPGFPIPIFTTALNLSGTVTLVFNRKEDGSTSPIYGLGGVTYQFPRDGQ